MASMKSKSAKEQAIRVIEGLPNDSTSEDILYHLYVRTMVEDGLKDIEKGRVVPHEEAKRRMNEWLTSFGRKRR